MKKGSKPDINSRYFSRRQFLTGLGGSTLLLPPLISMFPSNAMAAPVGRVRRVILIPGKYGIDASNFFPTQAAGVNPVANAVSMSTTPLSQFNVSTNFSRAVGSAFNDATLRSKVNFYRGLDFAQGGETAHHCGALAGCAAQDSAAADKPFTPRYGTTIDNIIGNSPNVYLTEPVRRIVRMATSYKMDRHSFTRTATGAIKTQSALMGDRAIFSYLFDSLNTGSTLPAKELDKLSVVDKCLLDANALKNHKRMTAGDKNLLDQFLTGLSDLQRKINANVGSVCTKPNLNLQVSNSSSYSYNGYYFPAEYGITSCDAMIRNYNEIIKNAFLCDLTRVVVYENDLFQDTPRYFGDLESQFHSHETGPTADKHAWFFNHLASLAKSLDAIPDPLSDGGTLLDNTFIYFTNEHAGVASHDIFSIPTMSIGSCGDYFKTGQYIDCRQTPNGYPGGYYTAGRPLKQLLISIMEAMGVTRAEYINYGDGKGFGEFDVYNSGWYSKYAVAGNVGTGNHHNDPLPFIKK